MNDTDKCPVCGMPWRVAIERHAIGSYEYVVWCGNGTCQSQVANAGANGNTEHEAKEKIHAAVLEADDL